RRERDGGVDRGAPGAIVRCEDLVLSLEDVPARSRRNVLPQPSPHNPRTERSTRAAGRSRLSSSLCHTRAPRGRGHTRPREGLRPGIRGGPTPRGATPRPRTPPCYRRAGRAAIGAPGRRREPALSATRQARRRGDQTVGRTSLVQPSRTAVENPALEPGEHSKRFVSKASFVLRPPPPN